MDAIKSKIGKIIISFFQCTCCTKHCFCCLCDKYTEHQHESQMVNEIMKSKKPSLEMVNTVSQSQTQKPDCNNINNSNGSVVRASDLRMIVLAINEEETTDQDGYMDNHPVMTTKDVLKAAAKHSLALTPAESTCSPQPTTYMQ